MLTTRCSSHHFGKVSCAGILGLALFLFSAAADATTVPRQAIRCDKAAMEFYAAKAGGTYKFNGKDKSQIDKRDMNYRANYACMVCNCYNEAGNQNDQGQYNVGRVVMTRSRLSSVFPYNGRDHSLCGIIKDPKQFSWYNTARTRRPVPNTSRCYQTMQKAMDYTTGIFADHYYANYIKRPKWARYMKVVKRSGNSKSDVHVFLLDDLSIGESLERGGAR